MLTDSALQGWTLSRAEAPAVAAANMMDEDIVSRGRLGITEEAIMQSRSVGHAAVFQTTQLTPSSCHCGQQVTTAAVRCVPTLSAGSPYSSKTPKLT